MTLEERLQHAREDLPAVHRKFEKQVTQLERALRISHDKKPRVAHFDYRSPSRNNWLVTLRVTKKHSKLYLTVWWQYDETGLETMVLRPEGAAFYFDTHFFQRYRQRESEVENALDNMRRFFHVNYNMHFKQLDTHRFGMPEVAGVATEGLFNGTVRSEHIWACDTFIAQAMFRPDQKEEHGRLHTAVYMKKLIRRSTCAVCATVG